MGNITWKNKEEWWSILYSWYIRLSEVKYTYIKKFTQRKEKCEKIERQREHSLPSGPQGLCRGLERREKPRACVYYFRVNPSITLSAQTTWCLLQNRDLHWPGFCISGNSAFPHLIPTMGSVVEPEHGQQHGFELIIHQDVYSQGFSNTF